LWKLVWRQLLAYGAVYFAISLFYGYVLDDEQAKAFELLIQEVRKNLNTSAKTLTFLLGFYVSLVVKRWWEQLKTLPSLDEVASVSKVAISLKDESENLLNRRTIVRYCLLSYVLCLRKTSSQVRRQYPSMDHLITSNLVRKDEAKLIGDENPEDILAIGGSNWWLPIDWTIDIIRKAQIDGRFATAPLNSMLVAKVCDFRKSLAEVASFGHVTIPLVYTQVVHLAVYTHFAASLIGEQLIQSGLEKQDMCVPIFLIFKFLFFIGWLNVAVSMYNPFGCDDADVELIEIFNRHIKVVYKLVDGNDSAVLNVEFWKPVVEKTGNDDIAQDKLKMMLRTF
jgi:predicted membrane chloride channel (bestrophin family)